MKNTTHKLLTTLILFGLLGTVTTNSSEAGEAKREKSKIQPVNLSLDVTPEYCKHTFADVDRTITKHLYSEQIAKNIWPAIKSEASNSVLASSSLIELDASINAAIKKLNTSHCQFVSTNDEMYYFLNSLFGRFGRKITPTMMDFTGVICGGVGLPINQVRYILDGSPAESAKIRIGDVINAVDGKPYQGQSNFFKKSGKRVTLSVTRDGKQIELELTPRYANPYKMYVDACTNSATLLDTSEGKVGYVRVWTGGNESRYALESALQKTLKDTKGLILDLRDGYGGNSLTDFDMFYRNPAGYPRFVMTGRDKKVHDRIEYYDKPMVVLINGGSRSGKELLAYALKKSGRAKLVGEKTAGFVLGGQLFELNDRASLYVAVDDCEIDGKRLEGNGVEPDVVVANPHYTADGDQAQLDKAREILLEELKQKATSAKTDQK